MSNEKEMPIVPEQSVNPQEDNAPVSEEIPVLPEPKNEQPITQDMEVHHHSHSHGKRSWKSYFWEFIMLFLAVFCGFLAEYQLEHRIEKEREEQFMQSMVVDLQIDSAQINIQFAIVERQLSLLDSLLDLINNQQITSDNVERLYLLGANSGRVVTVPFENRTSTQLKNAGGMRLVRQKEVADSIVAYWKTIERTEAIDERLEKINFERVALGSQIFHNKYYIRIGEDPLAPVTIKEGAQLINDDPKLLAEYSNRVYSRRSVMKVYRRNLLILKRQTSDLASLIKEAYHLD